MLNEVVRGNVPAHQKLYGANRKAEIKAICDWIAEDGVLFAITLTPNSTWGQFVHIKRKLKRLSAGLAYFMRGVPMSCDYAKIREDKPRIVGFEEAEVDTESDARIRHFHGLIGLRNDLEERFCRDFLDRFWSGADDPHGPNGRTYRLDNTADQSGGAEGWLRYALKHDAFVTNKEPIFIG